MNYKDKYQLWLNDSFFDEATRKELAILTNEKEIEDRFYRDLEFGTGGLRGIMGAGTNRINKYTIGKVTAGLGKYLLDTYGRKACKTRGVVIGYDTRNNSEYFSQIVANVLSGMGIHVYLNTKASPTPQLSFSVKFWKALAGVVLTASHNTKEYNGYKVYDKFGCQLVPRQAEKVINYIDAITDYHMIDFTGDVSLISMIDTTENFIMEVMKQSRYNDKGEKEKLKIVYTPLHGTGTIPVQKVLSQSGFTQVNMVAEQVNPDGNFSTLITPNPEDLHALEIGITQAKRIDADIVLGTDPDSDRVGVAVKTLDGYELMTGNQVGALLTKFIINHTDMNNYPHPAIIKTIVTSELGAEIARKHGIAVFSTLTGFKYIGEKITQFEQAKLNINSEQDYDFLFGYEESCGYLVGTHVRDKDAIVSCLLICEMAAEAKAKGKTLIDEINQIYAEFGYYRDELDSFTLRGKDDLENIKFLMNNLRVSGSPFENTASVIDYKQHIMAEKGFGELPISNVLKYLLDDGSWVAIRPSGTEPKIKIYYSIKGNNKESADKKLRKLQNTINKKIGLK